MKNNMFNKQNLKFDDSYFAKLMEASSENLEFYNQESI